MNEYWTHTIVRVVWIIATTLIAIHFNKWGIIFLAILALC